MLLSPESSLARSKGVRRRRSAPVRCVVVSSQAQSGGLWRDREDSWDRTWVGGAGVGLRAFGEQVSKQELSPGCGEV